MSDNSCSVEGCDRVVTGRGMCRKHYLSAWRAGTHKAAPKRERVLFECPTDHPHDLDTCWADHGCRCTRCQHLRRMERQRRRHKLRGYGRGDQIHAPRVPVGPVRDHLIALQGQGFGLDRIADAARVSRSFVADVYYGPRGAKRNRNAGDRTVRASDADRILAVTADVIDAAFMPVTGTARRLRALVAIGFTETYLAERLGMLVGNFSKIILGKSPRVTAATYEAVNDLFTELWATPNHGQWSDRARRVARENRWVGPLAWDDIDDPNERPNLKGEKDAEAYIDDLAIELALSGEKVRLTAAERREAVTGGHRLRWSDQLIAERLHLSDRTVLRIREELGLEAFEYADLVKRGAA